MSADKKKPSVLRAVSRPLVLLAVLLFISIFVMIGSLLYVGNKRADQQRHAELASEQLLLSQQMATNALGASSGREADFASLLDGRMRFEEILDIYRSGDTFTRTPPLDKHKVNYENYDLIESSTSSAPSSPGPMCNPSAP